MRFWKSLLDRCLLDKEYIIPLNTPFPSYHRQQNDLPKLKTEYPNLGEVHSQVLQTTIRRLHDIQRGEPFTIVGSIGWEF